MTDGLSSMTGSGRGPRAVLWIVLLVLCAFGHGWATTVEPPDRPRVLVLHSYAPDYSWTRQMHAGIVSVLESPEVQARYRVEYMDAKHQDTPDYRDRLLELFREKYRNERFDGILLTDNHALDFVARHRQELFPDTPLVASGINDPRPLPSVDDLFIIVESVAHRETLETALRLHPNTHTIHVPIDSTLTGQIIRGDFLEQTRHLADRVRIEILEPTSGEALLDFARTRTAGELIYLLVYFQDAAGRVYAAEEMPRDMAAASAVPVYVAWDFQIGQGTVGGCLTSAFGHGRKSAQTLLERLKGGHPPPIYDQLQGINRHTYDHRALQRFGLSAADLPPDALILHRPISYFEAHRSAILTALAIIAVLTVIIALLIGNVIRQRTINCSNAEILTLNREVIETQLELLTTLGEVIESRSHETANHVRRVAAYSVLLGRKLGLSAEDLLLLEAASPMHDVGKIGIPDAILQKPGRLTEEEYEVIKHHTVIGQRILRISDRKLLASARTIAMQHHERWDGTGYPCGLKGEEISLLARISAIADVYDALSTGRVYKLAWPQERVLDFIRQERGGMFDPHIVDLFLASLTEVGEIRERLCDPVAAETDEPILRPVHCPFGPERQPATASDQPAGK